MAQSPNQVECSDLFTPGRSCAGPTAVVLHEVKSGIENLDHEMCRCIRPRPLNSPGCHTSFHYGIAGNCNFRQYVDDANTAWGFHYIPTPACPVPPCPIVQTCDGIGADQYNPDQDGNLPTPVVAAGSDLTANCSVIHVAIVTGAAYTGQGIYCIGSHTFSERAYNCLVRSLCYIFQTNAIEPIGYATLLTHIGELMDLDLNQLAIDIQACIDYVPPPLPPCECVGPEQPQTPITANDSSTINLTASGVNNHTLIGTVKVSLSPGNQVTVNSDGLFVAADTEVPITVNDSNSINLTASGTDNHTLQADVIISPNPGNTLTQAANGLFVPTPTDLTAVVALDTNCINTTVTESPDNTFTVSSVPIISPTLGNQLSCTPNGLLVPPFDLVDCSGNDIVSGTSIVTTNDLSNLQVGGVVSGVFTSAIEGACPVNLVPDSCDTTPTIDLNAHQHFGAGGLGQNLQFYHFGDPTLISNVGVIDTQSDLYALGKRIVLVNTETPGNVDIINPPTDDCSYKELWIKNISDVDVTVSFTGSSVDGVVAGTLTLQGIVPGGYPFGNDGGEAVHLVYVPVQNSWYVL